MFMSTLSSRRDDARLNDDDRERDAGRCAHGDAGLDDDWSAAREHSRRANDPLRGHAGAGPAGRDERALEEMGIPR